MMADNPIEKVHKIDGVDVSTPIEEDVSGMKAKWEDKSIAYYAVGKDSALERIFDKILDTISGNNKLGKGLGKVKDAVTWIFPESKVIDIATDSIGDMLKKIREADADMEEAFEKIKQDLNSKSKTTPIMETTTEKIKRFLKQPSTRAGLSFVLMIIAGFWSGASINPDELLQSALGIVAAVAALWTSVENLFNIFRDDDKAAETRKIKR